MTLSANPLIHIHGLEKSFGATRALAGVSLQVQRGEVLALMGANGAGKSTLVNILSGALQADRGWVELDGQPYAPASPKAAAQHGVVTVHQSTDRVGAAGQRVADVLLLNQWAAGRGPWFLSRASVRRKAEHVASKAGFTLDLEADFGDISAADRQLVAIARAVAVDAKVLILDEPTACLSQAEAERLFAVVRDLQARGMAVVYISHRIADLQAIADRVVVLRGGVIVADLHRPVAFDAAVEAMIGRSLHKARVRARQLTSDVVLQLQGVQLRSDSAPLSLQVRRGEVVAITGHLGAGKSRLLRALFGLGRFAHGQAELNGQPYLPASPRAAIEAGVNMAGEDRHRSSLMPAGWPGATVAGTIALPHLRRWFPAGWLRPVVERRVANAAISRLGIKARSAEAPIETLSGGNQQKVVLARWQSEPAHLLLLDEPFQGVDVGARADIIAALRVDAGSATLIATSDPEEALEVADRIYVMDHFGLREARSDGEALALAA